MLGLDAWIGQRLHLANRCEGAASAHTLPGLRPLGFQDADFPFNEVCNERCTLWPTQIMLSDEDQDRAIASLREEWV